MKKSSLVAVLATSVVMSAAWVLLSGGRISAQAPGGPPPLTGAIAIIDINFVFKNNGYFKAEMAQMKADVDQAEAKVRADSEGLKKFSEQVQGYRAGSPDRQSGEEQYARRLTELNLRVKAQKDAFLQRESAIYNRVYQVIQNEVAVYCTQRGIALVLNYNGNPVDPLQAQDVLRVINSHVVYHAAPIDITRYIVDILTARTGTPPATANGGGDVVPRGVYPPRG